MRASNPTRPIPWASGARSRSKRSGSRTSAPSCCGRASCTVTAASTVRLRLVRNRQVGDAVYRGDQEKRGRGCTSTDLSEAYLLAVEADRSIDGEVFLHHRRHADALLGRDGVRPLGAADTPARSAFEGPMKATSASTWFDRNEVSSSAKRAACWAGSRGGPACSKRCPATYAGWAAPPDCR